MTAAHPAAVVVLAAGGGTRMVSATPKVLHSIGGRSLLGHSLTAARGLDADRLVVVVGHGREAVRPHVESLDPDAVVVVQEEQRGTGHAVQVALEALPETDGGLVVVTYGDVPLQTTSTLRHLVESHAEQSNAVTVLTAVVANPFGYGRIVREDGGAVVAVVEEKDASEEQRAIAEINSGIFVFDEAVLREALRAVGSDNAAGEMYLTDVVALARKSGRRVGAVTTTDTWQTEGANTRAQLAALGRELNRRVLEHWMDSGVEVIDPASTWVDVTVELARDVSLKPGVQLHGATRVDTGAVIGPDTTLTDVEVGAGAIVVRTHGSQASLGPGSTVGPFAYLRPGTVLGGDAKIGTFVETKNATLGSGAKVPHLSYVGDAAVGEGSNIGAGTIFANYDGVSKNRTTVGVHCRTGSHNTFVAPVEIGDGAATGAGTVVRRNVPPGALAVSGGPQRHIDGWVQRKRPGTAAADAADAARDEEEPQ
ncbi:MAG TPA: bifunctional UDP-N-acetylglucosamine diphosphorylase/glucosamine-1-phosphate N-acetyltransferase GlmU [Nocardioidaceae bacterium]|nr:bifunctional UDP-N-acetylglucosamine diphosphorylase/glucosamine-1-phosphate N-acetyltransferase GlmU [Nocardioidaceae bacterium]